MHIHNDQHELCWAGVAFYQTKYKPRKISKKKEKNKPKALSRREKKNILEDKVEFLLPFIL